MKKSSERSSARHRKKSSYSAVGFSGFARHLPPAFLILCALMLTSCAQSVVSNSVNLPPLPGSVRAAGTTTPWPKDNDLAKSQTPSLLTAVRKNELKQARAASACKAYHAKLQSLYGGK